MKRKLILAAIASALSIAAQPVTGLWDATVKTNDLEVPFKIEFEQREASIKGWFFNGEEKVVSSSGSFHGSDLALAFDYYGTKLEATLSDGALSGVYRTRRGPLPFRAVPHVAIPADSANVPEIAGLWRIAVDSGKGEKAWRFIVRQSGPEVSAAILRVDGDTGSLTGSFREGKFRLSHFSAARPAVLDVTAEADGTLTLTLNGKNKYVATREEQAKAQGLAEPTDRTTQTTVKDPSEPFRFSLPNLNGILVTESDARFRNKVVLINITGSWCPNCHDEAPFLAEIYRQYRAQGLEIVALSFEEAEQLANPTRLKAFVAKYGIAYTVLLGGEPSEAKDKLTQAVNWNSWPTTFFVGRDGLVAAVHAGFPSKASGELFEEAKRDFTATVERLLASNIQTTAR